jgi:DNA (cytosine-5)-methyltransferase 1
MLDLFAGAGGLTYGFQSAYAGFRTVRAVEMDLAAAASYASTFGDLVYAGKIEAWLTSEDVPEVDVVVGGPPCQGFSTLGKQDTEDNRSELWREYVKVVARAMPTYFVLENVPAFLKSPQFALFMEAFETDGKLSDYSISWSVLNAADYGAPQRRRRVILLGNHRDVPAPGLPIPTHARSPITIAEVWKGVEPEVTERHLPDSWIEFRGKVLRGAFKTTDLHVTRHYQSRSIARFRHIPPGGNRFDLPVGLQSECWKRHTSGSADVMGRLVPTQPSVTIRTEFFKPEKGRYLHPTEDRAITHLEAALLQGFSLDHQWVGSKVAIARQIGNAVPIALGSAIAKQLATAFLSNL